MEENTKLLLILFRSTVNTSARVTHATVLPGQVSDFSLFPVKSQYLLKFIERSTCTVLYIQYSNNYVLLGSIQPLDLTAQDLRLFILFSKLYAMAMLWCTSFVNGSQFYYSLVCEQVSVIFKQDFFSIYQKADVSW